MAAEGAAGHSVGAELLQPTRTKPRQPDPGNRTVRFQVHNRAAKPIECLASQKPERQAVVCNRSGWFSTARPRRSGVSPPGLGTEDKKSRSLWEWVETGLGMWTGVCVVGGSDCSLCNWKVD